MREIKADFILLVLWIAEVFEAHAILVKWGGIWPTIGSQLMGVCRLTGEVTTGGREMQDTRA